MRNMIVHKTGRRGAFLLFLVILDLSYGYSLIADKPVTNLILPWDIWGWIWIGCGLFIATGVLAKMDLWQFGIAALLKTVWGLVNLDVWIFHHPSINRGWVATAIWLSFAATVLTISGWPEPHRIVTIPADKVIARAEAVKNGESS